MNWVFGAYSSVYNTAMMNGTGRQDHVAPAKSSPSAISRLFGRR